MTTTDSQPPGRQLLRRQVRRLRAVPALDRSLRAVVFPHDLRRLKDVLAETPLAGHYWVWGGLLLGWAREGRVLAHDRRDADFAVAAEDASLFCQAVPALERAGYRRLFRFENNAGEVTEHSFVRHDAKFDFFYFFPEPEVGTRRYYVYGDLRHNPIQLECRIPDHGLEPFDFLRRRWMKPLDHESFLSAIYGDWTTPDPSWSYLDDGTIVDRQPWKSASHLWP